MSHEQELCTLLLPPTATFRPQTISEGLHEGRCDPRSSGGNSVTKVTELMQTVDGWSARWPGRAGPCPLEKSSTRWRHVRSTRFSCTLAARPLQQLHEAEVHVCSREVLEVAVSKNHGRSPRGVRRPVVVLGGGCSATARSDRAANMSSGAPTHGPSYFVQPP